MYKLLVRLMVIAAIFETARFIANVPACEKDICPSFFERASRQVLNIDWRPISIFPEEGKRFLESKKPLPLPTKSKLHVGGHNDMGNLRGQNETQSERAR